MAEGGRVIEYICAITDDYPDVPYGSDDYSGTVERRERIVRCRGCRMCGPDCYCDILQKYVMPGGFCAFGEPKKGGD